MKRIPKDGQGKDKVLFPLADTPTNLEFKDLCIAPNSDPWRNMIRAKATGEFRNPKKGEWYISGAIPEAYRAFNDLGSQFHIAKLVGVKIETTMTEI